MEVMWGVLAPCAPLVAYVGAPMKLISLGEANKRRGGSWAPESASMGAVEDHTERPWRARGVEIPNNNKQPQPATFGLAASTPLAGNCGGLTYGCCRAQLIIGGLIVMLLGEGCAILGVET